MYPMAPMNNPVLALVQAMHQGRNPIVIMQSMAQQAVQQCPQINQTLQIVQGRTPQQLQQIAQNMARERGVDLNQMLRQMGINASFR